MVNFLELSPDVANFGSQSGGFVNNIIIQSANEGFAKIITSSLNAPDGKRAGEIFSVSVDVRNDGTVQDDFFVNLVDNDLSQVLMTKVKNGVGPGQTFNVLFDNLVMPNKNFNLRLDAGHVETTPPPPSSELKFDQVLLSSTTLVINGPSVNYEAQYENTSEKTFNGVVLQGWVVQGSTQRAGGGTTVMCGGSPGVINPFAKCTQIFTIAANDQTAGGQGTFMPGPATALFQLLQGQAVLAEYTVQVNLI